MTSTVQKLLPEKNDSITEKALRMSLFLAQLFPEDGAENGRTIDFVRQRYLMNFCIKIKTSKNTTQQMTTAIWRVSARLKLISRCILNFPRNKKMKAGNPIHWSKDLIIHGHINNERAVKNKNKLPEILICRLYFHILSLHRLVIQRGSTVV